ncbi:uncharacterized protein isoform X2 [Choristoneura fumiferana]|uniref:uncharacterized protein isoform X2 n=1 Tax=Choristoneura fumiferana TaxID=7141 RepID=UPI003D156F2E
MISLKLFTLVCLIAVATCKPAGVLGAGSAGAVGGGSSQLSSTRSRSSSRASDSSAGANGGLGGGNSLGASGGGSGDRAGFLVGIGALINGDKSDESDQQSVMSGSRRSGDEDFKNSKDAGGANGGLGGGNSRGASGGDLRAEAVNGAEIGPITSYDDRGDQISSS